MIKKIFLSTLALSILIFTVFPTKVTAITAEERLIEVERQLQAIAEQISKYEGEKTDLEKAIIQNDKDLNQVNKELAEVQSRLNAAKPIKNANDGADTTNVFVRLISLSIASPEVLISFTAGFPSILSKIS